ncbi:uncharacterized protein B0T15DRAFT_510781 [Chaetomium strumarium]|uniref:Uncharacterized protein n=1 Tax=Chaetomium strumarium TaxID=1170767 RepID=A0AAJ0GX78_9PEZI|nr:hypothetical protein B0T15DRAFT_510781 [Chaetomium strumarium]
MKHAASMLLAAGLAAAQTTTVSILLPMADAMPQQMAGSVISAGPTATQYFVNCPSDTPSYECGLGPGLTVVYGPSTLGYTMAYTAEENQVYSVEANCKLDPSKDVASCVGEMVSAKATSHVSDVLTGYKSMIVPVAITAGADKLAGGAGTTTTVDSTATVTATGTDTTLSTATNTATVTNSQGTETTSATTSSSTGGVPRITQNAVVLGAAAFVGGAMLM